MKVRFDMRNFTKLHKESHVCIGYNTFTSIYRKNSIDSAYHEVAEWPKMTTQFSLSKLNIFLATVVRLLKWNDSLVEVASVFSAATLNEPRISIVTQSSGQTCWVAENGVI